MTKIACERCGAPICKYNALVKKCLCPKCDAELELAIEKTIERFIEG